LSIGVPHVISLPPQPSLSDGRSNFNNVV